MGKTMSSKVSLVLSCFGGIFVFVVLFMISAGSINAEENYGHIFFSDDGETLSFFGETLNFSRSDMERILSYPARSASFCADFLPQSLQNPTRGFYTHFSGDFKKTAELLENGITGFFTFGT